MRRENFIDLPFKSIIEKYDYYLEGKIDFIVCEFKEPNPRVINYQMKILKDNRVVTNKSVTNDLSIWNLKTRKVDMTLSGHTNPIMSIKILNDDRIVSLSLYGSIKIWNSNTGQCEHTLTVSAFTCMIISENDDIITMEKIANFIKVWDSDTGICKLNISIPVNKHVITIITIKNKLIFALEDFPNKIFEINIWNLDSKTYTQTITHPEDYINNLIKFDENRICREFSDNTLRIWNIMTGECEIIKNQNSSHNYFCIILHDKRMIKGDGSGNITIWNYGEIERTLLGHSKNIKSLKLLPDGRLISASIDGVTKIWNLESYECELTFNTHIINVIKILSDGRIITNQNGRIIVWK